MKTQNPLIGRSSQKFGTAIFQTWKGINVVRSKPLEVANPRSPGQRTQRNRLTAIVKFYRPAAAAVQLGYIEQAIRKSEYNAFVSENIITATTVATPDSVSINPSAIIISQGSLGKPVTGSAVENAGDVDLTWDPALVFGSDSDTDQLQVVQYNASTSETRVNTNVADRSSGSASVAMVPNNAGDQIFVYFFFYSAARRASSDQILSSFTI